MALTIRGFPDCRASLGPSQDARAYVLQPGTSDYVTGGYVITAAQVGLSWLFGAWIIGVNPAGIAYVVNWVFQNAQIQANPPQPYTQINMLITQPFYSGTGAMVEIANGTNLTASTWIAEFLGF